MSATTAERSVEASDSGWLRIGFLADGCFKLTLAGAYAVLAIPMTEWLSAPLWLAYVTALLVALSGIAEILGRRNRARRYVLYLAAYDTTWVAVSIVAFLRMSEGAAGVGTAWFAFQAIASATLAVLFQWRSRRR
ncbi:hypothetical protein [Agromyces sp. NPDC049794]|uniref:hypothetical protein n=1 Tax=unclassified Agromyces TaxID=2639701 RepID=UPI0033FF5252